MLLYVAIDADTDADTNADVQMPNGILIRISVLIHIDISVAMLMSIPMAMLVPVLAPVITHSTMFGADVERRAVLISCIALAKKQFLRMDICSQ